MAASRPDFNQLVEETYDALIRYAIRRVTNREDAADIVAETYLIAWSKFDQPIKEARPWLFGIARNVIHSHRRGELKQVAAADELRQHLSTLPAQTGPQDLHLDIQRALATLSSTDQEAIMLTAWDDLTTREAALSLGVSHSAFRVRLVRARRRLRAALSPTRPATTATTGASIC